MYECMYVCFKVVDVCMPVCMSNPVIHVAIDAIRNTYFMYVYLSGYGSIRVLVRLRLDRLNS